MGKAKISPQFTKSILKRLIIIHNAIKSGEYPNNQDLQRLLSQGENALPITLQWFVDEWKERIVAMTK